MLPKVLPRMVPRVVPFWSGAPDRSPDCFPEWCPGGSGDPRLVPRMLPWVVGRLVVRTERPKCGPSATKSGPEHVLRAARRGMFSVFWLVLNNFVCIAF